MGLPLERLVLIIVGLIIAFVVIWYFFANVVPEIYTKLNFLRDIIP